MRTLIKLSLLLMLVSVLVVAGAAWFALSDRALVTHQMRLSHQDIARARTILRHNDPRNMPAGTQRVIDVAPKDLNLAANYLLQQLVHGNARLTLATDSLQVQASLLVPRLPWRNVINIDGRIETSDDRPRITELRLGSLPVPGALATLAAKQLLSHAYSRTQLDQMPGPIKQLQLRPDRLRLTYQWHPELIDQARNTLLTGSEREALRIYHDHLVDLQSRGIGTQGSLLGLLQPLFEIALERSRNADPIEENTALLTVLGTWAGRQDISKLVPDAARRPGRFRLKIERRRDFAQHFLTSAALAARGDSALSDAVGLFKEISDTDHGSGFSFTDIAADRAGTRFGELATRSEKDARRVQQRLAAGVAETDIMPRARDLPEHMRADAFKRQFGYVGSPEYQAIIEEIDRRISTCNLYTD